METYEYDDNMSYDPASAVPDSRMRFPTPGPGPVFPDFVPDVSPNFCPNCNNFRPGNNMIYWTWRLFGPNVNMFPQSARVRFSNMTSIREPLNIYLNSRLVLSNLDPRTASGFLQIMPGTYQLTVYRSRFFASPIINTNVTFFRNGTYLLTILGTAGNARIQLSQQ
ncbi:MAG: DUF4397 domain-containing protein [Enterocloster asparagiformis]|nr:DUF4397 domain-containing protein [Enterocloster asparagiformis]